ncbi:SDR family NAD(P)-dependent oxidoreductase [Sphingosinicella microcystinivorans]|uniref:SDR family NAD(P)-dependent oxidoreductase n=1 Tax=Sphingosinicella microcystinivorans TaxID=335406 RepID=UPI0022F4030F|nr:SDR family NAD(P)-dependent oxidoreductase [Sphingosinicella microcystinivorans]WBX83759.1 SDR family NAD(P)-dependent oxidoreductase [Sphingosinicella microcystinivorans]
MELAGLSAVVTGGASGLGAGTARALSEAGVRVAVFDIDEQSGRALVDEIGGIYCLVDVTSDLSVDAGFAASREAHGQERILINCAGIGKSVKTVSRDRESGEIKLYPMELFSRIIGVNVMGTFRCIARSAAGMMTLAPLANGERGVIINTASIAATDGQVGQAGYSASKAAIVGMTLPIARDLMNEGIRVNTVLPGIFDTPLMAAAPEKLKHALASSVPFPKRFGAPLEYASLALEILRNAYLNGEDIRLDGAIRMPPK